MFCFVFQECPRFTLEKIVGFKVNDSVPINKTFIANHIGECFLSCFDRPDCLTFTFENITHNCKVYTACGTGCLSSVASGVTTYKRHCFTGSRLVYKIIILKCTIFIYFSITFYLNDNVAKCVMWTDVYSLIL